MALVNLSKRLSNLLSMAIERATESKMDLRHGAILFGKGGDVLNGSCNCHGHKIYGYDVPSLHAEARCLQPLEKKRSKSDFRYRRSTDCFHLTGSRQKPSYSLRGFTKT